jgi:hypothetical protein
MQEFGLGTQQLSGAAFRAELEWSSHELTTLVRRVELAVDLLPHSEAASWRGPANWAYQVSLALLRHQATSALELLRASAALTAAAAFEVEHHA